MNTDVCSMEDTQNCSENTEGTTDIIKTSAWLITESVCNHYETQIEEHLIYSLVMYNNQENTITQNYAVVQKTIFYWPKCMVSKIGLLFNDAVNC